MSIDFKDMEMATIQTWFVDMCFDVKIRRYSHSEIMSRLAPPDMP